MASIIRIKRSATSGNPTTLAAGELAYSSLADNGSNGGDRLYVGHGSETNGDAANHEVIGGKFFTDQLDHAKGTLTANSALIVDASKKINELLVDNITIDGNTISSTNTNGNIIIDPAGSGFVNVNNSLISNLTNPVSNQDAVTKSYADAKTLSVKDDGNNTDTINLVTGTLDFEGGTGLTSSVTDDNVKFTLDNTAVSAGSYGSQTAIPVITVDAQGRLTSASTASITTTLNLSGDSASSGSVSLASQTLDIVGLEGIDVTASGPQFTIGAEDATTSNKGVASFNSTDFTVTSGAVAVNATTLGSTALNPGETVTDLAGLTSLIVDNLKMNGNTLSSTDGSNQLFIDPAPEDSDGGDLIIRGNLTVQGVQTIINSTTMSVNDLNLVLADSAGNAAAADGAGITINGANATILYNGSTDRFDINKSINLPTGSDFLVNGVGFDERVDDRLSNLLQEGEGINLAYADASDTLTISAEIASSSNLGVAKFNTDNFDVTGAGDVTITEVNGGTY